MRKTFSLLLLAGVLVANIVAQSGRRGMTPPPPPRPETPSEPPITVRTESAPATAAALGAMPKSLLTRQLKSVDKGSFSLSDFAGKVIVVNLWATWCGPCRMEVPEYEKVRKEYEGRAVEFIGLTTEDPLTSANKVRQFARDFKFGFRLGWADPETARTIMNGRNSIPQTVVIAADGRIVSHWRGYSRGQGGDRLRQTIEGALTDTSTPAVR